jgi:uncharacterized protein YjbJ (UPF0337 family)
MEAPMNRFQEKAQARAKQAVGQMIGDDKLIVAGKEQERHADEQRKPSEKQASPGRTADGSKSGSPR